MVVLRRIGWILISLLVAMMTLLVLRYVSLDLVEAAAAPGNFLADLYLNRATVLYVHAFGSGLALLVGPLQFFLRRLDPPRAESLLPVHRWSGRVYLLAGTVGVIAGGYLAVFAYGGFAARLGFLMLAIATLWTLASLYRAIRGGDEHRHREWAIRSFSLLFAAVTLRLLQGLYGALGVPVAEAYVAVAWSSWVPNLIVAELIVSALRRSAASGQVSTA